METNLENSDDGPEQGVKILAVRDGVSVFCLQTEFTAKQMHSQYTEDKKESSHQNVKACILMDLCV